MESGSMHSFLKASHLPIYLHIYLVNRRILNGFGKYWGGTKLKSIAFESFWHFSSDHLHKSNTCRHIQSPKSLLWAHHYRNRQRFSSPTTLYLLLFLYFFSTHTTLHSFHLSRILNIQLDFLNSNSWIYIVQWTLMLPMAATSYWSWVCFILVLHSHVVPCMVIRLVWFKTTG